MTKQYYRRLTFMLPETKAAGIIVYVTTGRATSRNCKQIATILNPPSCWRKEQLKLLSA